MRDLFEVFGLEVCFPEEASQKHMVVGGATFELLRGPGAGEDAVSFAPWNDEPRPIQGSRKVGRPVGEGDGRARGYGKLAQGIGELRSEIPNEGGGLGCLQGEYDDVRVQRAVSDGDAVLRGDVADGVSGKDLCF